MSGVGAVSGPADRAGDRAGRAGGGRLRKFERIGRALLADVRTRDAQSVLPTERELAARYAVSRVTIRQALDWLQELGVVYRVQGAGTFVGGGTVAKSLALTSFTEDMQARGLTASARVLSADECAAGAVVGAGLGVGFAEPVVRICRLRLADGVPMCLETAYVPARLVPGLLAQDLSGSLYAILAGVFDVRICRAEQRVRAVVLDARESALLAAAIGDPALRVCRLGLDERGRSIEWTETVYRADRYELRFGIRRDTQTRT